MSLLFLVTFAINAALIQSLECEVSVENSVCAMDGKAVFAAGGTLDELIAMYDFT